MSGVGQPISSDVRRSRGILHLLNHGIKMMVRRDKGNIKAVNYISSIRADINGMTYDEIAEYVDAELYKLKDGIKERQSHTVVELERRFNFLAEKFGLIGCLDGVDDSVKYNLLNSVVSRFLFGDAVCVGQERDNKEYDAILDRMLEQQRKCKNYDKLIAAENELELERGGEFPPE